MTNKLTLIEAINLLNSIPNISAVDTESDVADVQDEAMRDYPIYYTLSVEDGEAHFYGSGDCAWSRAHVVEFSAEASREDLLEAVKLGHLGKLDWSFSIGS